MPHNLSRVTCPFPSQSLAMGMGFPLGPSFSSWRESGLYFIKISSRVCVGCRVVVARRKKNQERKKRKDIMKVKSSVCYIVMIWLSESITVTTKACISTFITEYYSKMYYFFLSKWNL